MPFPRPQNPSFVQRTAIYGLVVRRDGNFSREIVIRGAEESFMFGETLSTSRFTVVNGHKTRERSSFVKQNWLFLNPNCRRPLNPDFQQIPWAEETLIQGRDKMPCLFSTVAPYMREQTQWNYQRGRWNGAKTWQYFLKICPFCSE